MMHVLGFSKYLFPLWLDEKGDRIGENIYGV